MSPLKEHQHPDGKSSSLRGCQLQSGDILREGDVVASKLGGWAHVHKNWHGVPLVNDEDLVVRPEVVAFSEPAPPPKRGRLLKRAS